MTATAHVRARARRAAAGRAALGAVLLVLLLAVFPALRHLPAAPGSIRAGGVSIEWWYGGLLAPVAGWIVAVWALRVARGPGRAPGRAAAGGDPDAAGAAPPRPHG